MAEDKMSKMSEDIRFQNKNGFFYSFWDKNRQFHEHCHHQIELNLMTWGRYTATVDQKSHLIESGDLLVIFPNQAHSFDSPEKHCALVTLFSIKLFPEFENFFTENIPVNPVIRAKNMPAGLTDGLLALHDRFCGNRRPEEFTDVPIDIYKTVSSEMFVKGCALQILSAIIGALKFDVSEKEDSDILRRFVVYCNKNFSREISLGNVADELSVDKCYLSHLISNRLGTTYSRYINRIRINEAARKLKNSRIPITEIAFSVGYTSIRTFNRVFLSMMGQNPRDFRFHMSDTDGNNN